MLGKISVGVRKIAIPPITRIRMAITTKVYGRRNANLTIHIAQSRFRIRHVEFFRLRRHQRSPALPQVDGIGVLSPRPCGDAGVRTGASPVQTERSSAAVSLVHPCAKAKVEGAPSSAAENFGLGIRVSLQRYRICRRIERPFRGRPTLSS